MRTYFSNDIELPNL